MFVIYTKSGCPNCYTIKKLLEKEECIIINCDEFLQKDREAFIEEMKRKTKWDKIQFPMIFNGDTCFTYHDFVSNMMFDFEFIGDDFRY